jgi:hypothetical protein
VTCSVGPTPAKAYRCDHGKHSNFAREGSPPSLRGSFLVCSIQRGADPVQRPVLDALLDDVHPIRSNASPGGKLTMADIRSHDPVGRSDGRSGSSQTGGSSGGAGASEYGSRYYRQGSRAIGDMDSGTMTGLFIAGAIGFGLGWLVFGQESRSGDYVARRMSASSERRH